MVAIFYTDVKLQTGVNKIGVKVDRIELKQIGLPHKMQRNMASEAEAKVQSKAKMVTSKGEAEANNRLVEAGDSLGVVSLHLRYLQTMIRINQPTNVNHGYILPFPLEMLRLKKSFVNSGYDLGKPSNKINSGCNEFGTKGGRVSDLNHYFKQL